uniref:Uncharacterized protein n=1 Tax=Tetraselmis sp. GSL018 TaxID=582737 RepID=A0A061QNA9_9CHLO
MRPPGGNVCRDTAGTQAPAQRGAEGGGREKEQKQGRGGREGGAGKKEGGRHQGAPNWVQATDPRRQHRAGQRQRSPPSSYGGLDFGSRAPSNPVSATLRVCIRSEGGAGATSSPPSEMDLPFHPSIKEAGGQVRESNQPTTILKKKEPHGLQEGEEWSRRASMLHISPRGSRAQVGPTGDRTGGGGQQNSQHGKMSLLPFPGFPLGLL